MLTNPSTDSILKIATDLDLLAFPSTDHNLQETQAEDPLIRICEKAVVELTAEVAAVKKGNKNVLNRIVGSVMKESRGRADARRVKEIVERMVCGEVWFPLFYLKNLSPKNFAEAKT